MFTPYIINSLVPLAISTTLLVFQSGSKNTTKNMQLDSYEGTVGASAGYGCYKEGNVYSCLGYGNMFVFRLWWDFLVAERDGRVSTWESIFLCHEFGLVSNMLAAV